MHGVLHWFPLLYVVERGFDEYLGNISGNCDYYTHIYNGRHDLYKGFDPIQLEGYSTDIVAEAACQ